MPQYAFVNSNIEMKQWFVYDAKHTQFVTHQMQTYKIGVVNQTEL